MDDKRKRWLDILLPPRKKLEPLEVSRHGLWPWVTLAAILIATTCQLYCQGRLWWCECASPVLWDGDIWSSHNSQHLVDAYSFTHMLHGILFCGVLWTVARRLPLIWRLEIIVFIECLWEVLENSAFIIQRYREQTISLGYTGDSIANSIGDVGCCALGALIASRLGLWRSVILVVVTEIVLAIWVRDNLTLNVLMLIYPIDAIKYWQMVH